MGAATTQDVPGKPLREPDADRFDRRDRELQVRTIPFFVVSPQLVRLEVLDHVVGDVNVDQVEATIKKMFADVPAQVNPAKREQVSVPDNDLPLISIAKDKEASNTILYIFYKHDKLPNDLNRTIAGLVKDYIQQICASIMDERFDDILHQANPPFIYAQAYDDDNFMIAKSKGAWTVAARCKRTRIVSTR